MRKQFLRDWCIIFGNFRGKKCFLVCHTTKNSSRQKTLMSQVYLDCFCAKKWLSQYRLYIVALSRLLQWYFECKLFSLPHFLLLFFFKLFHISRPLGSVINPPLLYSFTTCHFSHFRSKIYINLVHSIQVVQFVFVPPINWSNFLL